MKKIAHLLLLSLLIIGIDSLGMDRQEQLQTTFKSLQPRVDFPKTLTSKDRKELTQLQRSHQQNQSLACILKRLGENTAKPMTYFYNLRFLAQSLYVQHLYLQLLQVFHFTESKTYALWELRKKLPGVEKICTYNDYFKIGLRGSENNPLINYFMLKYHSELNHEHLTIKQLKIINLCLCSEWPELYNLGKAVLFLRNLTRANDKLGKVTAQLINLYSIPQDYSGMPQTIYLKEMSTALSTWTEYLLQRRASGNFDSSHLTDKEIEFHKSIRMYAETYKKSEGDLQQLYKKLLQEMERVLKVFPPDLQKRIKETSSVQSSCQIDANTLGTDEIKDEIIKSSFGSFLDGYGKLLPEDVQKYIRVLAQRSIDLNQIPNKLPSLKLADDSWLSLPTINDTLLNLGIDQEEQQLQKEIVSYFEALQSQSSTPPITTTSTANEAAAAATEEKTVNAQESTALSSTSSAIPSTIPAESTNKHAANNIVRMTNPLTNCQEVIFKLKPENPIPNKHTLSYTKTIKIWLNNPQKNVLELGYLNSSHPRHKYFRECPWAPAAFHAFSTTIDAYVEHYGECTIEEPRRRMHIKVPGMMIYPQGEQRNGKSRESGVFHYIIDMLNYQCFHRMFTPVKADDFVNRAWENLELNEIELSDLPTQK